MQAFEWLLLFFCIRPLAKFKECPAKLRGIVYVVKKNNVSFIKVLYLIMHLRVCVCQ